MDGFSIGVLVVFLVVGLAALRIQQAAKKAAENEHVRQWGSDLASNKEIKGAAVKWIARLLK